MISGTFVTDPDDKLWSTGRWVIDSAAVVSSRLEHQAAIRLSKVLKLAVSKDVG
jgi:hypothetical protein